MSRTRSSSARTWPLTARSTTCPIQASLNRSSQPSARYNQPNIEGPASTPSTNALTDYAGLYPPAKLDMPAAVEAYNRCKIGEHEAMLGRFICPVARLDEFSKAAAPLLPGTFARSGYRTQADSMEPWRLSVIV